MAAQSSLVPDAPRIGLYFTAVNRNSYLIAKTLALGGCKVFVRLEIPLEELLARPDEPGFAEREYCSWLYSEEDIQIIHSGDDFPEVDALLYQMWHLLPQHTEELHAWMKMAAHVTAWNANNHECSVWQNLRGELVSAIRFARLLLWTRNVVMQSGRIFLRPTSLLAHSRRQGYFTHPKFLREPVLRAEMFSGGWEAAESRPVRLIFSGNPEPESRRRTVESLRGFLQRRADVRILNHYEELPSQPAPTVGTNSVLWMVRAPVQDPLWYLRRDVIPPAKWPAVMRLCDFAFCPPGDERKTHRVVESMLQGVIPILDCPEEYDAGLRDGVNCLVVRQGRWQEAVQHALELSQPEVQRLRQAVQSAALKHLHHAGTARNWLTRLGLLP